MDQLHTAIIQKTNRHEKQYYFKMYTTIFIFSALIICSWFFFTGRTFISQGDGILQHYPALIYYAEYLRSIVRSLFLDHQLIVPNWDFSIGEGSDILATLHYYVIGDPFAFFSVFIPTRYMYLYYELIILLRLYLAGIAFSCLCFQTGQRNQYGILAGSMTYVFCYWALHNIVSHPYFLNPMLYMPMLIIGIEKILKKERPYVFIFSVLLSAVSNFYFFYMLVFITVIYVIVRMITSYRNDLKVIVFQVFRIGMASVLGVLLSSVILFPIFYTFISDTRMTSEHVIHLFYPLSYYSSLPAHFLTSGSDYWMCMGFSAPVLPAVFLLFHKKKQYLPLKILFFICVLIALFPFLGHAMNGFSYVTNRWSWAFALLCAYILSAMWPSLMQLKHKELTFLIMLSLVYFIACILLEYSRKSGVFTAIIFVLFFLLLSPIEKEARLSFAGKQKIALLLVITSIFSNSFWTYSSEGDNYAADGMQTSQMKNEYLSIDAAAVNQTAQAEEINNFWRFSGGNDLHCNGGFKTGLSSTSFYWTLSNPNIADFRKEISINEGVAFNYLGYDARTALIALASVLYYVMPEQETSPIPYGFNHVNTVDVNHKNLQAAINSMKKELQTETLTEEQIKALENAYSESFSVYRNDIPLPLAYTYNNVLSEETWNNLTAAEKQEAMLQAVYLKDYASVSDCKKSELNLINQKIDYTIIAENEGISLQENAFFVTAPNSSVTLEFDGLSNSETYLSIHNLSFTGKPEYDLYFKDAKDNPHSLYSKTLWNAESYSNKEAMRKEKRFWKQNLRTELNLISSIGVNNNLTYDTEEYSWYNDRHDFILNMGYSDDKITSITISFSDIGIYSFDSLEVICQPMEHYVAQISELRKDVMENVIIGTDSVTGTITLDKPKVLCFSIPYSIGWSAKVDGEETPLYQANTMYMGIPLNAGEHVISLQYATPFLKEGFYVSCASLFLLIIYVIMSERKKHIQ
jgi:uncharacterized membrane protein YfhO